ncbi:MAG TPA: MBL fold metallo-hydrolase [Desulfotomaculum sp.]|nr:MBL fold metallo-hydrolase [Desulfotomaculum sp.]
MLNLKEIDSLEITTLIDNYSDLLLADQEGVKRFRAKKGVRAALLAEHGLSLLIQAIRGEEKHTVILDAGWTGKAIAYNLKVLEINLAEVETIVLSHGHMDHFGGLKQLLALASKKMPLVCHPDAFLSSRVNLLHGVTKVTLPSLKREEIISAGAIITESKKPYLLGNAFLATTGEIPRQNTYEKGNLNMYLEKEGKLVEDLILDDQSIIANVRNKGLVVIAGCAHAGIVNTVHWAQKITGQKKVYAILGGLHLSGTPNLAYVLEQTVKELKALSLAKIIPMHCTGWQSTHYLSQAMPEAFILNSIGSSYYL